MCRAYVLEATPGVDAATFPLRVLTGLLFEGTSNGGSFLKFGKGNLLQM